MSKTNFTKHLYRYKNIFRSNVVKKAPDGIYKIYGRYGEIAPYAPDKQLLGLYYMERENLTVNTRRRNIILKALKSSGVKYDLIQDGDIEFGATFPESQLMSVCSIIKATPKRKVTQEERFRLNKQLKQAQESLNPSFKSALFEPIRDNTGKDEHNHYPSNIEANSDNLHDDYDNRNPRPDK